MKSLSSLVPLVREDLLSLVEDGSRIKEDTPSLVSSSFQLGPPRRAGYMYTDTMSRTSVLYNAMLVGKGVGSPPPCKYIPSLRNARRKNENPIPASSQL